MAAHPEPLFLSLGPGPLGQRFALHHAPCNGPAQGLVVYVHPFAEEMNKARRMAALQARAFAARGFAVLQIDLLGCGDSGGDFGDATWEQWLDDVVHACRWLQQRHAPRTGQDAPSLWIWGLRLGCLLATEALARLDASAHLLLIQPPLSGKTVLQQFLRLGLAGSLVDAGGKNAMAKLRAALARDEPIELAGYVMNAALAAGMEAATLAPCAALPSRRSVVWLELRPQVDAEWSPMSLQAQQRWRDAGYAVEPELVSGPAFWQTTEIEEAPDLVAAACRLLTGTTRAPATALDRVVT